MVESKDLSIYKNMGIEKNDKGVYLPDKNTKWPEMTNEERSKVYKSLKEKDAGRLAQLDSKAEMEKKKVTDEVKKKLGMEVDDFWQQIGEQNFANEFEANDPLLKGMPVSMAILLTFKEKFFEQDLEEAGLKGKEKQLMLFCLNYLQNAPENKAKNPTSNIDFVPKNGHIKIQQNNDDLRWELQIFDPQNKIIFAGYLFPDDF